MKFRFPIVIIDEPQSVDSTPKAQEAIKSLNPLCIFRYSATHKNLYNLVYKLDPIKAYELRLVKQIVVASVQGTNKTVPEWASTHPSDAPRIRAALAKAGSATGKTNRDRFLAVGSKKRQDRLHF